MNLYVCEKHGEYHAIDPYGPGDCPDCINEKVRERVMTVSDGIAELFGTPPSLTSLLARIAELETELAGRRLRHVADVRDLKLEIASLEQQAKHHSDCIDELMKLKNLAELERKVLQHTLNKIQETLDNNQHGGPQWNLA